MEENKCVVESIDCPQCEILGEETFSKHLRKQKHIPAKVIIKSLPDDISESGIKNLFLCIGEPIYIEYHPAKKTAIVEFQTKNEAELAVRDLNGTPPYNLKVFIIGLKSETTSECKNGKASVKDFSPIDFKDFEAKNRLQETDDDEDEDIKKEEKQLEKFIESLHYDPSVRIRQKIFDKRTKWNSISLGRGYYYTEKNDHFVDGLQSYTISSDNKSTDFKDYFCGTCNSLTIKYCDHCSEAFCSQQCVSTHLKDSLNTSNMNEKYKLKSGCTVVISTFYFIHSLFVRILDKPWEEFFCRLCNNIAVEAFNGKLLEKAPEVGDVCIAKYIEDSRFYRARIEKIDVEKNEALIEFIDFGNVQKTSFKDLRQCSSCMDVAPRLAIKIQLKDVPKDASSPQAVAYLNSLTSDEIPLIAKFSDLSDGITLTEADTNEVVNHKLIDYCTPSWKKDETVMSKLGEVFFFESLKIQNLIVGKTYNLGISHVEEKEFLDSGVFWATDIESDEFLHVRTEMQRRVTEYCEFLKNDSYLPRVKELCLAKEKGHWHRCVNLKTHNTKCFLLFVDSGNFSLVETYRIRKIIADFVEAPAQGICCILSGFEKLKMNQELLLKVLKSLKEVVGTTIDSVVVEEFLGDMYRMNIPFVQELQP